MSVPPVFSGEIKLTRLRPLVDALLLNLRDKPLQIKLALSAMLSGGHVLIEDAPGTGKTSLARALGFHLHLEWKRLQCTNDTTPSDIVGVNIFNPKSGDFAFKEGPIFTPLLLADELNRAPSKSQSALLEAMAEHQITIDGTPHNLPTPFIVIATQNPLEQVGVSPLPESQLDRFAVSFSLGLPSEAAEGAILRDATAGVACVEQNKPMLEIGEFAALQAQSQKIIFADALIVYLQQLALRLRAGGMSTLSVRALIQIKGLAQAHAMIEQRDFCVPEDIQAVIVAGLQHRMGGSDALINEIMREVPVP